MALFNLFNRATLPKLKDPRPSEQDVNDLYFSRLSPEAKNTAPKPEEFTAPDTSVYVQTERTQQKLWGRKGKIADFLVGLTGRIPSHHIERHASDTRFDNPSTYQSKIEQRAQAPITRFEADARIYEGYARAAQERYVQDSGTYHDEYRERVAAADKGVVEQSIAILEAHTVTLQQGGMAEDQARIAAAAVKLREHIQQGPMLRKQMEAARQAWRDNASDEGAKEGYMVARQLFDNAYAEYKALEDLIRTAKEQV